MSRGNKECSHKIVSNASIDKGSMIRIVYSQTGRDKYRYKVYRTKRCKERDK